MRRRYWAVAALAVALFVVSMLVPYRVGLFIFVADILMVGTTAGLIAANRLFGPLRRGRRDA